jgi:adenosylcobinamide-GDP ribazoletransferase
MQNLLQAIAFLTRIPVGRLLTDNIRLEPAALPWYPCVGLLLAAMLYGFANLLPNQTPDFVGGALLLLVFTWLTGALHLDGVADSMDAFMGAHANPERALEIMKDPRIGAMGTVALVLALILKFVLFSALWSLQLEALFAALVLARANVLLLFYFTPYVRTQGSADNFKESLSLATLSTSLVTAVLFLSWLPWLPLVLSIASCAVILLCWRQLWIRRIKGFTGDIAGALIEISEIGVLIVFVLAASPHG